jgi:hypothetical protein
MVKATPDIDISDENPESDVSEWRYFSKDYFRNVRFRCCWRMFSVTLLSGQFCRRDCSDNLDLFTQLVDLRLIGDTLPSLLL